MGCLECGDTRVIEARGECPECAGLGCIWENGLGRECQDCDGTGWIDFIACDCLDGACSGRPDCPGCQDRPAESELVVEQARPLHRRSA